MAKLPQKLFVRWNEDDPASPFLMAGVEPEEISEENESVPAGIYQLDVKVKIKNDTTVSGQ